MLALTLAYAAALVPEIADDVVAVDEAMRWGYTWKWGPFELIDQIGVDTVIALLKEAKIAVPPLLQQATGRSFYRVQEGRLEFLTLDGQYAPVRRRPGVLLLEDVKRKAKPLATNRLGEPVGHRRRRPLSRVPQQDECARSRAAWRWSRAASTR